MSSFTTQTLTLSAVGNTAPIELFPPARQGLFSSGYLQPFIGVNLTNSANLTYTVQVSGDDPNASTINWFPFTGLVTQTASAVATVGAAVRLVRLNVPAWVSGTATLQVCQVTT